MDAGDQPFFGIVVTMYYTDHALPRFHAKYGEHRISVATEHARILLGAFPDVRGIWSSNGRHCIETSC